MTNSTSATGLTSQEAEALDRLEDRLGRGVAVKWDEPKTVRGILTRPIETATVKDYNDSTKTVEKQVATLRTAEGLAAIWAGPSGLEPLFELEGSGHAVIVSYTGEKVSQSSGRPYKAFDVVSDTPAEPVADEQEPGGAMAPPGSSDRTSPGSADDETSDPADDDIPF